MALPMESQGLFEKAGIKVHYSGIGKLNAAYKAMEVAQTGQYQCILNLGTAGSHKLETHSLIECSGVVQRDMDLTILGLPLGKTPWDEVPALISLNTISQLPKGLCGTGDLIELGEPRHACDLMDMEAYAIAKVCVKMKIRFHSIKYITDKSDGSTREHWKAHLKTSAEKLLKVYQDLF